MNGHEIEIHIHLFGGTQRKASILEGFVSAKCHYLNNCFLF